MSQGRLTSMLLFQHCPRDKVQKILHALKSLRALRQSLMNRLKCDILVRKKKVLWCGWVGHCDDLGIELQPSKNILLS